MPQTVVFLWISALGQQMPAGAQLDELFDYGAARGLTFVPAPTSPTPARPIGSYDSALAELLDGELDQARTSLSALEEEAARQRLTHVERTLLAHPELPQAGFLMAECLSLQAQALAADPQAAAALRARGTALEGTRALAFGEPRARDADGRDLRGDAPEPQAVTVSGIEPDDELEIDGAVLTTATASSPVRASLRPGPHHVRVLRNGRLVHAAFVELRPGQQELTLAAPARTPCGYDDLNRIRPELVARGAPLPSTIACPRWALARPHGSGVEVALCRGPICGAFVQWQRRPPAAPFAPLAPLTPERSWLPGWAGFALAGAGAALATGFVLWQSGALERGPRATTTLEYGGLNPP